MKEEMHIDDLKEKAICCGCVSEAYLKALVTKDGEVRTCDYCNEDEASLTLDAMADLLETAFGQHFECTATDMDGYEYAMHKDPESNYSWERKGEPTAVAIMNAAEIDEEAAEDLQRVLADRHEDFESAQMGEETAFAEEAHYQEIMPDDAEWREAWMGFERSIQSQARFFSRSAADQLAALFDDIDQMRTRDGAKLVVEAGPGKEIDHLFRARAFQSDKALCKALERPDREMCAPPSNLAVAGRMNAKGISTFYGATEEGIALAEVRPPVGSQVAVARFELIRPLRLLDLNRLSQIHEQGSIFDPSYARRLSRMMFLRSFCRRISRPVMPDDQDVEYLATQAIADYLATEGKVPLDGILFPSVQAGGKGLNAVLFQKASRCEEMTFPEGTELEARTGAHYEDGWEREYSVVEQVPAKALLDKEKDGGNHGPYDLFDTPPGLTDPRATTLRIDLKSVKVAVIERIKYSFSALPVGRTRFTKSDTEGF